jgi:hypothetical protein
MGAWDLLTAELAPSNSLGDVEVGAPVVWRGLCAQLVLALVCFAAARAVLAVAHRVGAADRMLASYALDEAGVDDLCVQMINVQCPSLPTAAAAPTGLPTFTGTGAGTAVPSAQAGGGSLSAWLPDALRRPTATGVPSGTTADGGSQYAAPEAAAAAIELADGRMDGELPGTSEEDRAAARLARLAKFDQRTV